MKNRKQLLADFYLELLSIPMNDPFRSRHQELYGTLREVLAQELDCDSETVQNIFERMAAEDVQTPVMVCCDCNKRFSDSYAYASHKCK